MIPIIGGGLSAYFVVLSNIISGLQILLSTISEIGCKTEFSIETFSKLIMSKISSKKITKSDDVNILPYDKDSFCKDNNSKCCSPDNYINIADALSFLIKNPLLKSTGLYPGFVLFIEALYDSALTRLDYTKNLSTLNFDEKKMYLYKILEIHIDKIPSNGKNLIEEYLNSGNENLINDIKKYIPDNSSSQIIDIKTKLELLENNMIQFSKEDNSQYIRGKSLFKTIFKIIFVDIFCNVASTSKSSSDIIREMGDAVELVDMLKAGTSTGFFLSIIYFITVIVLIICGIFNIY